MRHFFAAALLATSVAQAGEAKPSPQQIPDDVIASRVVNAPTPGQVLILELSNRPPEPTVCGKGTFMARIMLDTPPLPNASHRINLGCWRFAPDAWGGRVKYDAWDQVNHKPIAIDLPTSEFKTTKDFTEWADYAGL